MEDTELARVAIPRPATISAYVEDHEGIGQPSQDGEDNAPAGGRAEQELAPVNGGPAAWRLLCAAFVFEALLWGFPLSFGVFQEYYSKDPEFADNRYVSIVGTIASGFGYLGAPVVMPLVQRYHRWQRQMIWVGWSICIIGLVLWSFASTLEVLILTRGLAWGVGFLIHYYPIISMVNEYWIARRGMAYGGQLVFGFLSDRRVPLSILACLSTMVAAVACFTMWKLAESLTLLIFFAVVYGFFGAGFTAIWARMSTAITDDVIAGPMVFALLDFGKGIGNVLAGPIGGLMVSKQSSAGTTASMSYRWVIIFTGTCMFASTCIVCLRGTKYLMVLLPAYIIRVPTGLGLMYKQRYFSCSLCFLRQLSNGAWIPH